MLEKAVYIEANAQNFSPYPRRSADIEYIVIHYTSNVGDTARNNAIYFRDNAVTASAHYFVSDDSIYQCVRDIYPAYAVGIGSMKRPYKNMPMYGKIRNANSISIELCGSKTGSEASEETKRTAAIITAELLHKYNLKPDRVYRHYDVTGKECPRWAVTDPTKWLDFLMLVSNYYHGKETTDDMKDTPENYSVFKTFMERYEAEKADAPAVWANGAMEFCAEQGLIKDGRPCSGVNRAELATVLKRLHDKGVF